MERTIGSGRAGGNRFGLALRGISSCGLMFVVMSVIAGQVQFDLMLAMTLALLFAITLPILLELDQCDSGDEHKFLVREIATWNREMRRHRRGKHMVHGSDMINPLIRRHPGGQREVRVSNIADPALRVYPSSANAAGGCSALML